MKKKIYFATICLSSPIAVIAYLAIFTGRIHVPSWVFPAYTFYFWPGLLVLLVDLWKSALESTIKILWTFLNLAFGVILLPVYWVVFIQRSRT